MERQKDKIILDFIEEYSTGMKIKMIDIGSGSSPLKSILPKNIEYTSLDIEHRSNPDILCDLNKEFPVKSKEYDFAICTEVLEHTFYPRKIIREIKRITKDDGFIIISLPNEYNFYLRIKFLFGIQNNTEIPFREDMWMNHIHKARIKDLINLYEQEFNVKQIAYSWDSFSGRKLNLFFDKIIRSFLILISKSLFARSVIFIGR